MKKIMLCTLIIFNHYIFSTSEKPKEENIGKQDVIDSLSNLRKEIKDSGIYEQAAEVGKAIDEFAHKYPWIVPGAQPF